MSGSLRRSPERDGQPKASGGGRSRRSRRPATSQKKLGGKGAAKGRFTETDRTADSLRIPNAFETSLPHVSRCREASCVFHLPPSALAAAPQREFVLVERKICGMDDPVYSQHRDVWECVPQGNARVYVKADSPSGTSAYVLVGAVNGLRKFGSDGSPYGYPDAVQTVVSMEKENGACGHLSAFLLPPAHEGEPSSPAGTNSDVSDDDIARRFWVIGSSGVHIVLDYHVSEKCLRYYSKLGCRYSHAVRISRLWKAMLPRGRGWSIDGTAALSPTNSSASVVPSGTLTAAQVRLFHDTLRSNMWTSCFTAILSDSQPRMNDDAVKELRFYAVTLHGRAFETASACRTAPSSGKATEAHKAHSPKGAASAPHAAPPYSMQDGLCLPVAEAEALYASVGLSFASYSGPVLYNSPDYVQLLDSIHKRMDSGRCVMYGANADGKVMRMWEVRSYLYIMERATREAIVNHKLFGKALQERLQKRLNQQQPEVRDCLNEWEASRMPWLLRFASWLQMTQRLTPHARRDELDQLRNDWLSLQKDFQAALDADPQLYDACGQYQPDPLQWGGRALDFDVVKFVGPQGCGKSVLSRALYVLLQKAEYRPRWVNQDECGSRNKFLAALRQATQAKPKMTHLIIDKMNLDADMNHDYDDLPLSLTVTWFHPDGESALYKVCIARVLGRGKGHRTIYVDPDLTLKERQTQIKSTRSFVRTAVRACEVPKDRREVVLVLDITTPLDDMLQMMWEKLQENGTHTLPAVTDTDVGQAIDLARQYESLLRDLPHVPTYACIGIRGKEDVAKLLSLVPSDFTTAQVVQTEFHLTTKYFGGEMDPVTLVELAKLLGQSVTLTLEFVVGDADGVAVVVRRDDAHFPCANPIPHITISNRPGVPPKYSNELISPTAYTGDSAKRKVLKLPPSSTVKGIFEFR
ncbi:hypothetical protein LSCM1_01520 [Leishmania martiniquensis]|uniref:tRNA ligase phosphodiesterase domain-containing protein n=1 Tax=Leishmania martiniquensis TaxID=1580590 RepID=A0A836FY21_9TRYP|nr:hypothetical protein LSCM1_01520 [Leishmania martiniquensis]